MSACTTDFLRPWHGVMHRRVSCETSPHKLQTNSDSYNPVSVTLQKTTAKPNASHTKRPIIDRVL